MLWCLSCPSTQFNLGLLIFIDVAFCYTVYVIVVVYRTSMVYTTITLIKDVFMCGGHHDSDRMAVLGMICQAEIIIL